MAFSLINHPFWGAPHLWKPPYVPFVQPAPVPHSLPSRREEDVEAGRGNVALEPAIVDAAGTHRAPVQPKTGMSHVEHARDMDMG